MLQSSLKRLWENVGSLLLAFALAFAVWISAVVAADPNKERSFPRPLALELRGQDPAMILLGDLPSQVNVTLSAPNTLWDRLVSEVGAVEAFIDLSGLEAGQHTLPIQLETSLRPVRVVSIVPQEVVLALELRATQTIPVTVTLLGEPALGFQRDALVVTPLEADVTGPQSIVAEVETLRAVLDISGARGSVVAEIALQAVDADGNVITGVEIVPGSVQVAQNILQAGGYRDVAVKVETIGQPAAGFRVTSISVSPPIVTLFSSDFELVAQLPGFVSTLPLDLTNADEDLETRLALDLPTGVTIEGEQQSVEVVIGIAPIESSVQLSVPVEVIGLTNGNEAVVSPQSASLILSGPLSVLESLLPGDVRLLVDVSELEPGTHLLEPLVEILPENVQVLSITPSSVEVVITSGSSSSN